jgi:hypothetical protein
LEHGYWNDDVVHVVTVSNADFVFRWETDEDEHPVAILRQIKPSY